MKYSGQLHSFCASLTQCLCQRFGCCWRIVTCLFFSSFFYAVFPLIPVSSAFFFNNVFIVSSVSFVENGDEHFVYPWFNAAPHNREADTSS